MMQKPRTRGLEALHGLVVLIWLPLLFSGWVALNIALRPGMLVEDVNFPLYLYMLLLSGILFLGIQRNNKYEFRDFQWVKTLQRTNIEVVVLALSLFLVAFATKDQAISRLFLATFLGAAWISLLVMNHFVPKLLSRLVFSGQEKARVLLIGNTRLARILEGWGRWQSTIGIEVVGLVTFSEEAEGAVEFPHLGLVENLEQIIQDHDINQLIILESKDSLGWVTFITRLGEIHGCRILIYNQWEEYFNQQLIPVIEGSHTFFTFMEEPLENPLNRIFKRLLDLVVAIPVILILLPLVTLIAWGAQRLQSPGPLFFRQQRGGRRGRPFEIFKFRTMHVENPEESRQASPGDKRIFPFGDFMRKTSLDEFPQFMNVLLGQMSVVGPRPHMLVHDEEFSRIVDIYRNRHFIKPGITGLAQIRGFRGEVTDSSLIAERVRYDLEYINKWTIWLDIAIIFRTFWQIFFPPKTAY